MYLHSLQDNGAGIMTGISPVQQYSIVFQNLQNAI